MYPKAHIDVQQTGSCLIQNLRTRAEGEKKSSDINSHTRQVHATHHSKTAMPMFQSRDKRCRTDY